MKKYLVTYHAPATFMQIMQEQSFTQEDMQRQMELWMAWFARCGEGLVDRGAPLIGSEKLTAGGSSASDKKIAGYSILQAEDMAAAQALLEGHPHLSFVPGCEIEVHEAMPEPAG